MEEDIKKLLPLYLNCPIMLYEDGKEPVEKILQGYYASTDQVILDKVGYPADKVKLILRKASDMTREEHEVWRNTTTIVDGDPKLASEIHWVKRINYYRSIHVDCDGLIEAGLAIYKHDLPQYKKQLTTG